MHVKRVCILHHTRYVAIENVHSIDERSSKSLESFRLSLFLDIFAPRSSIVKSVFDCQLPGEFMKFHKFKD